MRDVEHGATALAAQATSILRTLQWLGAVAKLAGLRVGPFIDPFSEPVVRLEG